MASDGIGKLVDVAVKIGTTAFGRSRRSNGSLATIALFRGKLFRLTAELVNGKQLSSSRNDFLYSSFVGEAWQAATGWSRPNATASNSIDLQGTHPRLHVPSGSRKALIPPGDASYI